MPDPGRPRHGVLPPLSVRRGRWDDHVSGASHRRTRTARSLTRARRGINQASVKRPESSSGRTFGGLTDRRSPAILPSNQSAATTRLERPTYAPGPARRHFKNDVPAEYKPSNVTRTRSRSPIPRSRRARKHKSRKHHVVPIRHIVRHRTSLRNAAYAPPRECRHALLLRHQRLPELPRSRSRDRPGHLRHLWVRTQDELTRAQPGPEPLTVRRRPSPPPGRRRRIGLMARG